MFDMRVVSVTEECFDEPPCAYTTQEEEEEEGTDTPGANTPAGPGTPNHT
jgi:hypothetical protein